eukprot:GEZU01023939.1.p1 GENE.GEZU01023939.1~~GEZU01023939.1.p1  ORF type:complete len:198 (+),score=90.44 GEZU01023939.1:155-748(+)
MAEENNTTTTTTTSSSSSSTQDQEYEGASPNEILIEAAKRDNVDMLRELIAMSSSGNNGTNNNNSSRSSFNVNHVDGIKNSSLHYCCQRGHIEVAKILLELPGINLSLRNFEGNTPLHLAAAAANNNNSVELVRLLLEKGAKPDIQNKLRQTALDVAASTEIKDLIRSAMWAKKIADDDCVEEEEEEEDADDDEDDE